MTVMLCVFIIKQAIIGTGMNLEVTDRGWGGRIGIRGLEHQ